MRRSRNIRKSLDTALIEESGIPFAALGEFTKAGTDEKTGKKVIWGPVSTEQKDYDGEILEKAGIIEGMKTHDRLGGHVDYAHAYRESVKKGKPDPELLIGRRKEFREIDGLPCMQVELYDGNELAEKTFKQIQRGCPMGFSVEGFVKAANDHGKRVVSTDIVLVTVDPMPKNYGCRVFPGMMPLAKALVSGMEKGSDFSEWQVETADHLVPLNSELVSHETVDLDKAGMAMPLSGGGASRSSSSPVPDTAKHVSTPEYQNLIAGAKDAFPHLFAKGFISGAAHAHGEHHERLKNRYEGEGNHERAAFHHGALAGLQTATSHVSDADSTDEMMNRSTNLVTAHHHTGAETDTYTPSAFHRGFIKGIEKVHHTVEYLQKGGVQDPASHIGQETGTQKGISVELSKGLPASLQSQYDSHSGMGDAFSRGFRSGITGGHSEYGSRYKPNTLADLASDHLQAAKTHMQRSRQLPEGHADREGHELSAGMHMGMHQAALYHAGLSNSGETQKALTVGSGIVDAGATGGATLRTQDLVGGKPGDKRADRRSSDTREPQRECPQCHAKNKAEREKCRKCGKSLDAASEESIGGQKRLDGVERTSFGKAARGMRGPSGSLEDWKKVEDGSAFHRKSNSLYGDYRIHAQNQGNKFKLSFRPRGKTDYSEIGNYPRSYDALSAAHQHHAKMDDDSRMSKSILVKAHIGFDELVKQLMDEHGYDEEKAKRIAAYIGRKKFGAKGMARRSAAARKSVDTTRIRIRLRESAA